MRLLFLAHLTSAFPTHFYQVFDVCPAGRLVLEINRGKSGYATFDSEVMAFQCRWEAFTTDAREALIVKLSTINVRLVLDDGCVEVNNMRHCTRFMRCRNGKCANGEVDDHVKSKFACTDAHIKQFALTQRTEAIDTQNLTISVRSQWPNLDNIELEYTNADITGRPVYTSNDKRYFYFNSKRKQWLITSTYCQNPLNGSFWGYEFFDSTALHPLQIESKMILSANESLALEQSRDYLFNTPNDQIVRWDDVNMWRKFTQLIGVIE